MKFLYSIVIYVYGFTIYLAQFFNKKAKLWIKGRKHFWEKLLALNIPTNKKVIWIHVSSLGEFEQGRPIIENLKKKYSNIFLVLTFFSPSGYEIRKNYSMADAVLYLPLDTKKNAKKFYQFIKPNIVIFIKYDFWYYYIFEAYKRSIPIFLISAVFKAEDVFFKPYGIFFLNMLKLFTKIYTQDVASKLLLEKYNISAIVAGDTRCDRVIEIANTARVPFQINSLIQNRKVVVAGSVWLEDLKILKKTIDLHDEVLWIIAPHNVEKNNVNKIVDMFRSSLVKYSELINTKQKVLNCKILIIDNIGMLASLYKIAKIAYIGGGFGKGIHNTLEPAVYGIPVIFGPKYHKFNEAIEMLQANAAFTIRNENDAIIIFNKLLTDDMNSKNSGVRAKKYIESKSGATNIIINELSVFLT